MSNQVPEYRPNGSSRGNNGHTPHRDYCDRSPAGSDSDNHPSFSASECIDLTRHDIKPPSPPRSLRRMLWVSGGVALASLSVGAWSLLDAHRIAQETEKIGKINADLQDLAHRVEPPELSFQALLACARQALRQDKARDLLLFHYAMLAFRSEANFGTIPKSVADAYDSLAPIFSKYHTDELFSGLETFMFTPGDDYSRNEYISFLFEVLTNDENLTRSRDSELVFHEVMRELQYFGVSGTIINDSQAPQGFHFEFQNPTGQIITIRNFADQFPR